jgi:predicted nucleic acid-binding protein
MNALVDTSVWSLLLRRKSQHLNAQEQAIVAEIEELIWRAERGSSVSYGRNCFPDSRRLSRIRNSALRFVAFADEPEDTTDHEGAAQAVNDCRARGFTASPVDALICEVAFGRQWAIFAADTDFESYAKVLPLKLHVPRT